MKKSFIIGAIALLSLGLASCGHDHGEPVVPTPPVVPTAATTLSGIVTNNSNQLVAGATVTVGDLTATTDENGFYEIAAIEPGTYAFKATAPNGARMYEPYNATVTVKKTSVAQKLIQNALLYEIIKKDFTFNPGTPKEDDVDSQTIQGNQKGEVNIEVSLPADASDKPLHITITPIYTQESAAVSRANSNGSEMLIGANLACDQDVTLSDDLELTFSLDSSVTQGDITTMKYQNGKWVKVDHAVTDGGVVIKTKEFTSFGVFLTVNVKETVTTETIAFDPSVWDNLDGYREITVTNPPFDYKVGTKIDIPNATQLQGLLVEFIARLYGTVSQTVSTEYPLDVTLPVGTALQIKGAQEVLNITATSKSKSVSATHYGDVNISTVSYNRDHNGGSSVVQ